MELVLVAAAAVALIMSLVVAALRVGRHAVALRAGMAQSHAARLEALVALDRARERLDAMRRGTDARRDALDGELADLARARQRLALLTEAAGETLRLVRLPR